MKSVQTLLYAMIILYENAEDQNPERSTPGTTGGARSFLQNQSQECQAGFITIIKNLTRDTAMDRVECHENPI